MEPKGNFERPILNSKKFGCYTVYYSRGGNTMEQFATEADVMRAAADRTDDTNADVNREIDRIQQVAESTRGFWVGNAQRSFDELMVRYDDAQRRLSEALSAIAVNIRDNAKNYETTDATNTDSLRQVSAGLAL